MTTKHPFHAALDRLSKSAMAAPGTWITKDKLYAGDVVAGYDVNFTDLPNGRWFCYPGIVNMAVYIGDSDFIHLTVDTLQWCVICGPCLINGDTNERAFTF